MHFQITEGCASRQARLDDAVDRLDGLGLIDAALGETAQASTSGETVGFAVSVDGVELPVLAAGYEVVQAEGGPVVTLSFPAESVTVGRATDASTLDVRMPAVTDAEAFLGDLRSAVADRVKQGTRSVWSGDGKPDPRERIPGWTREAAHA